MLEVKKKKHLSTIAKIIATQKTTSVRDKESLERTFFLTWTYPWFFLIFISPYSSVLH